MKKKMGDQHVTTMGEPTLNWPSTIIIFGQINASCLSIYLALTDSSLYCFATCSMTVMPRRSDSNDQSTTTENSIQMTFLGKVTPEILAVNNVCFIITPKLSNF